jgi:hypothetical protein
MIPQSPLHRARRPFRLPVLAFAVAATMTGVAHAGLRIERLVVKRRHGVYYLNTRLHIVPNRTVRHALLHGIPITLSLKIHLDGEDGFLFWGDTVARIDQRYRIAYHTVLGRYVVRNLETGVQTSYPTFGRVVFVLEHLRGIPLVDSALLSPHERYRVRARVNLHVDDIPNALRWLAGLWTNWESSSRWASAPIDP